MTKNERKPTVLKSDLIKKLIQRRPNLYPDDVKEIAVKILNQMSDALRKGERIEIRGFGSFCIRQRKSRIARNPKTGERFQLTERGVPHFKPGKTLLKMLNSPQEKKHTQAEAGSNGDDNTATQNEEETNHLL